MKTIFAVCILMSSLSLIKGQNCRVAALCTNKGKTFAGLRKLPVAALPSASGSTMAPMPLVVQQRDKTASANCKAPGWIIGVNGYQYKIVQSLATWDEAKAACSNVGATLPRRAFDSVDGTDFLVSLMKSNGDKSGFWLPLSDRAVENNWVWDGGDPLTSNEFWAWGQPDGSGDCGWISRDMGYKWDDGTCSGTFAALCERKI